MKQYKIVPIPKPRMTRSDAWKKRPCVMRYWEFKDKCKELKIMVENKQHICFNMPMPKSWSKKKQQETVGKPHKQKPDVDNLCKALLDAVLVEDSHIYDIRITKYWAEEGSITICNLED